MSHSFKKLTNNTLSRIKNFYPWCYWNNAFSDEEIDKICELMTSKPLETGLTSSNFENTNPTKDTYRVSHVNFHPISESNSWIFERINEIVEKINADYYNFDLNGYNFVQYGEYRDTNEGHYNWHLDSFLGDFPPEQHEQRKLSVTLLLSEPGKDFEGGELQFNYATSDEPVTIDARKGTLILFPSFLIHRVTKVTKGTRKSLVAWVLGPQFR